MSDYEVVQPIGADQSIANDSDLTFRLCRCTISPSIAFLRKMCCMFRWHNHFGRLSKSNCKLFYKCPLCLVWLCGCVSVSLAGVHVD